MKRNVLDSFSSVLSRQKPEVAGEPYRMKVFSNSLPRSVGDPWRGAYSAHGFWYKFHEAGNDEFGRIVAHSYEQDKYMLNYDYLFSWQNAYGANGIRVLVAKNLKNEIMGGVVAIKKETYTQIGTYFVKEEFRHSGIGLKLFKEISRGTESIVFQAMHHLHETLHYVGLTLQAGRKFFHYRLDNPSGFTNLKV
uniref:N-acetyltransferase domain-containing protein n=1 Tax=Heterorhabditis bacteriophora TaxID=37862 RepID=A0A1I7XSB0_HETBA